MPPPAFDQQVTFLYAEDVEAAWAFYQDVLGLAQVLDQGGVRIYRASPSAFVGICRTGPDRPRGTDGVILTLVTPHVDQWADWLKAAGAEIVDGPKLNETYNIYHLFFRDPAGYLLEIQEFRDPSWPKA